MQTLGTNLATKHALV